MIDIPSAALDVYNEFFAHHELTYFCQLSLTKLLVTCPYQEQLGVVMAKTYGLGNYNASLFATEGIASVGLVLAPVSALACGLVIGLGNCLSGTTAIRDSLDLKLSAMPSHSQRATVDSNCYSRWRTVVSFVVH